MDLPVWDLGLGELLYGLWSMKNKKDPPEVVGRNNQNNSTKSRKYKNKKYIYSKNNFVKLLKFKYHPTKKIVLLSQMVTLSIIMSLNISIFSIKILFRVLFYEQNFIKNHLK